MMPDVSTVSGRKKRCKNETMLEMMSEVVVQQEGQEGASRGMDGGRTEVAGFPRRFPICNLNTREFRRVATQPRHSPRVAASIGLTGADHGPMRDIGWSDLPRRRAPSWSFSLDSPPTCDDLSRLFSPRIGCFSSHFFFHTHNHRSLTLFCHDSEVFPPLHDIKTLLPGSNSVRAAAKFHSLYVLHCR